MVGEFFCDRFISKLRVKWSKGYEVIDEIWEYIYVYSKSNISDKPIRDSKKLLLNIKKQDLTLY